MAPLNEAVYPSAKSIESLYLTCKHFSEIRFQSCVFFLSLIFKQRRISKLRRDHFAIKSDL